MSIHLPELTPKQITDWIGTSAELEEHASKAAPAERREPLPRSVPRELTKPVVFDFSEIRQALNRAALKTFIPLAKPLRRWRRNQGAVNQSVIDCLGGTVTVVEGLVAEIQNLRSEIADLRAQLHDREALDAPRPPRHS